MEKPAKQLVHRLAGILLLAGICGALLLWNVNQPPSALYKIEKLKVGAGMKETIELLGPPDFVIPEENQIGYTRFLSWGILYIQFDNQNTYVSYEYDK